jgi:hypothetical protein
VTIRPHESRARGGSRAPGSSAPARRTNRKRIFAWTGACLIVAAGLAYGAIKLTHVHWGAAANSALPTSIQNVTTPAVTPTTTAAASPSSTAAGAGTAGTAPYALSAPATAGGYSQTSQVSATVKEIVQGSAAELMRAVEAAGGKTTSNVSAEYLIAGDQVLGYAGYNGSFSPKAVISALRAGAAGVTSESAGPHGGQLACGQVTVTQPESTTGEACVWATASTVGLVEFYGNSGGALETVTPAKAGEDTLKLRDGVEGAKQ